MGSPLSLQTTGLHLYDLAPSDHLTVQLMQILCGEATIKKRGTPTSGSQEQR